MSTSIQLCKSPPLGHFMGYVSSSFVTVSHISFWTICSTCLDILKVQFPCNYPLPLNYVISTWECTPCAWSTFTHHQATMPKSLNVNKLSQHSFTIRNSQTYLPEGIIHLITASSIGVSKSKSCICCLLWSSCMCIFRHCSVI